MSSISNASPPVFRYRVPLALCLLLAAFFATRWYNLLVLPVFTDEAGHMQIAWDVAHGAKKWRLMSDGRVLCAWFPALAITWAPDPLWSSRFFSTLAGAVTLISLFFTSIRLFSLSAAVCTALGCILCPYLLTYDRMVMAEPYLCATLAFMLWMTIRLSQEPSTKNAVILAIAMGLVPLGKVPGIMLFWMPFAYAWLVQRARPFPWLIWIRAYSLGAVLCAYPMIRFLSNTPQLRLKSIASPSDVSLFQNFLNNLHRSNEWLSTYWSLGILAIGLVGLAFLLVQQRWLALWLVGGILTPIIAFSLLAHYWVPRYLIFSTLPLLLAVGFGAAQLIERAGLLFKQNAWAAQAAQVMVGLAVFALTMVPAWAMDFNLLTDPPRAPFAPDDRTEYIEQWPSGYTKAEAFTLLKEIRAQEPKGYTLVVHDGLPETMTYQFDIYFKRDPGMHITYLNLNDQKSLEKIDALRAKELTLVFWYDMFTAVPEKNKPLWYVAPGTLKKIESRGRLIYAGKKPGGNPGAMLYRLEAAPKSGSTP